MNQQQDKGTPASSAPKIEANPPESRDKCYPRLRFVITLTFVGDIGTIFAGVGVVVNTSLPVTTLLVLVLPVLALATVRMDAYCRMLAADTALTLATALRDPATTD